MNLNHNGFDSPGGLPFDKNTEFRVKRLASIIPLLIKPRKTVNKKQTSYGMKHFLSLVLTRYCENEHSYITNGEFISAMIMAGFQPVRLEHGGPNCFFRADYLTGVFRAPHLAPNDWHEASWKKMLPNFYNFRKEMMIYKQHTFFTPLETPDVEGTA
jgi:hypothetical protein